MKPDGMKGGKLALAAFEKGLSDRLEGLRKSPWIYRRLSLRDAYSAGWESIEFFDRIHSEGIKRHGTAWLLANMKATAAFRGNGIEPSSEPLKTALSLATLWILDACCPSREPKK